MDLDEDPRYAGRAVSRSDLEEPFEGLKCTVVLAPDSVSPRAQTKERDRIEKTTTSKGLMHSNDRIKGPNAFQ